MDPDAQEENAQWASIFIGLQDNHAWEFVRRYQKKKGKIILSFYDLSIFM
jgi:hypothetical protein